MEMRPAIGNHVFGCDICQDVCPWNRGVEKRRRGQAPTPGAEPNVSLVDWLRAEDEELVERYDRLYVPRNDGRGLKRNAIVALGNTGRAEDVTELQPYLAGDDSMLREAATWARARIEERHGE